MNHKVWGSIALGVAAAALLAVPAMEQIPRTVQAEEYNAAARQCAEENEQETSDALQLCIEDTPYAVYEMMSEEQRSVHSQVVKFSQDWEQHRFQLVNEHAVLSEPMDDVAPENARLMVSQEELDKIWQYPVNVGIKITSPYGWRVNPVTGSWEKHKGIDLDGDRGDDILAARGGVVIAAAYCSGRGYYVQIDHGDGFVTEYFHLTRYIVKKGDKVTAGDVIGYMGSTGRSTGSHLHFGMMLEGKYVDPEDYIEF